LRWARSEDARSGKTDELTPEPAPAPEGTAEALDAGSSTAAAAKPGKGEVDLDAPKAAMGTTEVHATIAGKEVVFRRGRLVGNPREGFALTLYESLATAASAAKGELNLKLSGAVARGKQVGVTVTFLQIGDDGPHSMNGVRALECTGKGKLVFANAPPLPKNPPNEEVDLGEATGGVSIPVKCDGRDKAVGAFLINGSVSAKVLVIPAES
jgi:hypothetical protein